MTALTENEDAIIKTALLIGEDESAIAERQGLVEIRDTNADTEENKEHLRSIIAARKFGAACNIAFRDLLRNTFLDNLYQNAKSRDATLAKEMPIAKDVILRYFVDITNAESAYDAVKKSPETLQEIVLNECILLQSPGADSSAFSKSKVSEMRKAARSKKLEEVMLNLANTLYKRILFGNIDTPLFIKQAAKGKEFCFSNGKFASIRDLFERAEEIPDEEFRKYAQNNDFQNWLQGAAFGEGKKAERLAKQMQGLSSKKDLCDRITQYSREQEQKRLAKGRPKSEHILAAKLFLKDLQQELHNLIPFVSFKEHVKCLMLVGHYILEAANDPFRQEFVAFLRNPFEFLRQKAESGTAINHRFDFADYFRQNIEFNIRYKSGIDANIKGFSRKFAQAGIVFKADYDACSILQKGLADFIEKYKDMNLPDMNAICSAKTLLDSRLGEANAAISSQRAAFGSAQSSVGKKLTQLKGFMGRSPTERNISVYHEVKEHLASAGSLRLVIDAALVPEYAEFTRKKSELSTALDARNSEIREYFDEQNKEIRDSISAKVWDTEQDVHELRGIKQAAEKPAGLAAQFYKDEKAEVREILDVIDAIISGYEQQKQGSISSIDDAVSIFYLGVKDLEKIQQDPAKIRISAEGSRIEAVCRAIQALDKDIAESTASFSALSRDQGLHDKLAEFESAKSDVQEKILEVKTLVSQEIDAKTGVLQSEATQAYDYSQEIILLKNIEAEAGKVAETAGLIGYTAKNDELSKTIDLVHKKIRYINDRVAQGEQKIADVRGSIERKQAVIQEKCADITAKQALQAALSVLGHVPERISECADWREDLKLKKEIESLESLAESIAAGIDDSVEKAITATLDKARAIKPAVKSPEKASIVNSLKRLKNRRIYLSRLSIGKYSEKTREPLEEVNDLIAKAETALGNFRKGVDQELGDILGVLNQKFEWSEDEKTVKKQLPRIDSLEKDAANLEYAEKQAGFAEARALVSTRLKGLEDLIAENKLKVRAAVAANEGEYRSFAVIKASVEDSRIIEKASETVQKLNENLKQHAALKRDQAYADIFAEADAGLAEQRTQITNHILERINSLACVVDSAQALAAKQDCTPGEIKGLKESGAVLDAQRQRYLVFDKSIFKGTVAKKIQGIDRLKERIAERINELADYWDAKIEEISAFLEKNEFMYSQDIPKLDGKQRELEGIQSFCDALQNGDLLGAVARNKALVAKLEERIQSQFNDRKNRLGVLVMQAEEDTFDVDLLFSKQLDDKNVAQCYLLLQRDEQAIKQVDAEWKKDNALNDICNVLDGKVAGLRKRIEDNIFAEVAKINAAADQHKRAVEAAALLIPNEVTELLAAEAGLRQCMEDYSKLLRHEQQDALAEKSECVQRILRPACEKVNALKAGLGRKVAEFEQEATRDHKYTQDKEKLEKCLENSAQLKEFLLALHADEELGRMASAEAEASTKIQHIHQAVSRKGEELDALHLRISSEKKAELEKFWENIWEGGSLQKSVELLSALQEEVSQQGSWRPDDALAPAFRSIDDAFNKLKEYQFNKATGEISGFSREANELAVSMLSQYSEYSPELVSLIKERAAQADAIKAKLEQFGAASQGYDVESCIELCEGVVAEAKHKCAQARNQVAESIERAFAGLQDAEFEKLAQIPALGKMQSGLAVQKKVGSLVGYDPEQIDFLDDYIQRQIQIIRDSAELEREAIGFAAENIKHSAAAIARLMEHPLQPGAFSTAMILLERARRETGITLKSNEAAELTSLVGGLELLLDDKVDAALGRIRTEAAVCAEQIAGQARKQKLQADMRKLKRVQGLLSRRLAECGIFRIGKYAAASDKSKDEVSACMKSLQDVQRDYRAELNGRKNEIKKCRKELIELFEKARASEGQPAYIPVMTEFGEKVKQTVLQYEASKGAASECLQEHKFLVLLKRMREEAARRQGEICILAQKEIYEHTESLQRPLHKEAHAHSMRELCGSLREKRRAFVRFRKSLLDENEKSADRLAESYKVLIERVVAIKKETREDVRNDRQQVLSLQDKVLDFEERRRRILAGVVQDLPSGYMSTVRAMDSELKGLQESVAGLYSKAPKDKYSRELLDALKAHGAECTRKFTGDIASLCDGISQKRKLQDTNILGSRTGFLRAKIRKFTKVFSKTYRQETADIRELEDIRQYHEQKTAPSEVQE